MQSCFFYPPKNWDHRDLFFIYIFFFTVFLWLCFTTTLVVVKERHLEASHHLLDISGEEHMAIQRQGLAWHHPPQGSVGLIQLPVGPGLWTPPDCCLHCQSGLSDATYGGTVRNCGHFKSANQNRKWILRWKIMACTSTAPSRKSSFLQRQTDFTSVQKSSSTFPFFHFFPPVTLFHSWHPVSCDWHFLLIRGDIRDIVLRVSKGNAP